nr:reverse transcriptase domain-containing protein [Tanacetum cinerariifolium]
WPCGNLITLLTSLGGFNFSRVQLASRFFVGDIYGDRVVSCIVSPTLALHSSLERIVTTSGRGFDDWQCRLATLPFTFFGAGGSSVSTLQQIGRALIDVYAGELTLRVNNEAVTFNLDQTLRYSSNYNDMTANRIEVIDMACKEYSQEVLGFSDMIVSGNPTSYYDPIISTSSPTLTPFENSDFLFEEVDAFLALEDDLTSPEVDHFYFDTEGDILLLEAFLNDDPSLPPPTQGMYFPQGGMYALTIELNEATRKDHFPLPFMDQMLERLAGNEYYCFLDGFLGYFQVPIDPKDQEKTTFTCPYGTFAYCHMPFALCNAPGTFQ